MFKKLRHWHFDLALFLGLAIFSWAYWYSKPRPAWTSNYTLKDNGAKSNSFTILGYSADSQSIYTSCETTALSRNWPVPQIQRWSTKTGELLEDYAVEIPEEDRYLLQLPRMHYGYSFTITLCSDPSYLLVRYHQSKQKNHHYLRLYRINGKPVGQGLEVMNFDRIEYLADPSGNDRHWVMGYELKIANKELPISVIDFDTGKTLRTIQAPARADLDTFPTLNGGRYLVVKKKPKATDARNMELFDIQTGESLGQLSVPSGPATDVVPLDESHWAVCTMIGNFNSFTTRIDIYQYDPGTKTFQPDSSHPLNGMTSPGNSWLWVKPPYLLTSALIQNQPNHSTVINTLLSWLARIGIARDTTAKSNLRVADLATGQPLRQVTGIPFDITAVTMSPDLRYLANNTIGSEKGESGLSLYTIPHYLWEPTLSWLQWLSWLLVFPWPLRYFVASHAEFTRHISAQ